MSSRLINVRLDERRLERARRLRANGIMLSDLVRDAIDRQYEQLLESAKPPDIDALIKEIYEQCPDPPSLPARDYNVHNRHAAKQAIMRKLRSKKR